MLLQDKDGMFLLSGYPWGKVLARNTFMALPGATIAINHREDFEAIMESGREALVHFMNTGELSQRIGGIDLPDIPLWCIWALRQYAKAYGKDDTIKRYLPFVKRSWNISSPTATPTCGWRDNGLVYSIGTATPVTWMNASLYGRPLVPRSGYMVEFNALWYNALMWCASLTEELPEADAPAASALGVDGRKAQTVVHRHLPQRLRLSLRLRQRHVCRSIGASQHGPWPSDLTTAARPPPAQGSARRGDPRAAHPPKDCARSRRKASATVPSISDRLKNVRWRSTTAPARPWLFGFYADAYLRVFGVSGVGYLDRMLIGYEDEMTNQCIGSLSQLYDGNPPFSGRGAISHVTNIAEILRTLTTLKNSICKPYNAP